LKTIAQAMAIEDNRSGDQAIRDEAEEGRDKG